LSNGEPIGRYCSKERKLAMNGKSRFLPNAAFYLLFTLTCLAGLAGSAHAATGNPYAWGDNGTGALGDGTTTNRLSPVSIINVGTVNSLAGWYDHSVAAKSDGTVWAWGNNMNGQLGDGTLVSHAAPAPVPGLTSAIDVAVGGAIGGAFSVALKSDGTVWAWGGNSVGQLGDGTTVQRTTPVQVSGLAGITSITCGSDHCLALKSDGTLWGWGANNFGQSGGLGSALTPVQVTGLSGVTAMAVGFQFSAALKSDGTVWAWGFNYHGVLGNGTVTDSLVPAQVPGMTGVTAIAAGNYHMLAVKSDGTVWAWGQNTQLQLGDGSSVNRSTPGRVNGLAGVVGVAAGSRHSLALKSNGTVWAWGNNSGGGLGDGTASPSSTPVEVSGLASVVEVAGGGFHSMAIQSSSPFPNTPPYIGAIADRNININTNTGSITFNVGDAETAPASLTLSGTSSNTTLVPNGNILLGGSGLTRSVLVTPAAGQSGAATISVTATDGGGLTTTETFVLTVVAPAIYGVPIACGYNAVGQLGDNTVIDRHSPVTVVGATSAISLAGGGSHSVEALSDGTVWAWGGNTDGQLGDWSHTDRHIPVQTIGLTGITMVAAGNAHSLALKSDGTVWAWGDNSMGQLGDTTTLGRHNAVQVFGLTGAIAIAAGYDHSLALKSDGTVWAWGNNFAGQVGDNTITTRKIPFQVSGLTSVAGIGAGMFHSMARKSDGTVWTWGYNGNGQLGDGTTTERHVPVQVSGLTGVTAIAGGGSHSLAVKSDGTIRAWGSNGNGQLGDSTTAQRLTPVAVAGITGATGVAGGGYHSVARTSDGAVWVTGYNTYGQLGDGGSTQSLQMIRLTGVTGATQIAAGELHTLAITRSPVITSFTPAQGLPGTLVTITGINFSGATGVTFNGTAATSFTINSATTIVAAVPAGATTGRIGIIRPGGGATSTSSFLPLYRISGKVTQGGSTPAPGVTIRCNGSGATVQTDGSGNYLFIIGSGAYTVTPSQAGYSFDPVTRNVNLGAADATGINFVRGYSVSGRVAWSNGVGMENVRITRTLSATPIYTNTAGYFTFTGVPNGTYQITPSLGQYSFAPAYASATVAGANVGNVNFTGGYAINGRISNNTGIGLVGLRVYRTGSTVAAITNGAGYYAFYGVANGAFTLTPDATQGYGYTPVNRSVTINGTTVSNQNFIGTSGYSLSGRVMRSNGTAIPGVSVTRTGSAIPATTNSAGYYTFNGVPNGTYTLTPARSGSTFTPTTKPVTVNGADVSGQNFIGTGP